MKQLVEFLINNKSTGIIQDNNFIDLGLESGTLWATCNIGAKEETDTGHYYQWGGLEPMDNKSCEWKNAPFNNGQSDFDKKYFNSIKDKVCPNDVLAKEYDIAYQTYKGKVRMPTKDDFDELISYTNNEWIDNYNNSGVNGRLFTGKNGNSIFIPTPGYRYKTQLEDTGYLTCIWSSTIYFDNSYYAWGLNFSYYKVSCSENGHCYGQSVRPVIKK